MYENLNKASLILESDVKNLDNPEKSANINRNKVILELLQAKTLPTKLDLHSLNADSYHAIYDTDYSIFEEYFIRLLLLSKLGINGKVYPINPELRVRLYSNLCLKYKKKKILHKMNRMKKAAVIVLKSNLIDKVDHNYLRDHMTRDGEYILVDRRVDKMTPNSVGSVQVKSTPEVTTKFGEAETIDNSEEDEDIFEDNFINYMWKDMFSDDIPVVINRQTFDLPAEEQEEIGNIILSK